MIARRSPLVATAPAFTAWIVLLAVLAGCRRNVPPPPPAVPVETGSVRASLDDLAAQARAVRRYQGFVRIRGSGPDGGFSGRLVVVFERPHHLRVDLLGAFGATRWSAIADEAGIVVVFPGPKQYVQEEDTADIVGRLLGVRLDASQVMAILAGAGTPLDALDGEPRAAHRRGAVTVATLSTGERIELSEDGGQITSVQTSQHRVGYPTSWQERRRHVPDSIRLETDSIQATLTPEDVDVNVQLDPAAFAVEIPEGAERLRPSDVIGEAVFVVAKEPR